MPKTRYAVLTDSACDMPYALEEESGVDILSFDITVDGKGYAERIDFDFDEYYDILRSCQGVPSTAHVTQTRFLEKFNQYADAGCNQLLYVSICGSGSATLGAAAMARDLFYKKRPDSGMAIHLVDSRCYSMGYGWPVAEAAKKLKNGAEMADVVAWLEDTFSRMEIALGAFSLGFMKKSGRISAAAAFAGELLGLRPVISLNDGVSVVRKKVRGDKELLPALLDWADANIDDTYTYGVGGTDQARVEELAALCEKRWKARPVALFKLGAAVATNTGPDAIAIIYLGQKRARG